MVTRISAQWHHELAKRVDDDADEEDVFEHILNACYGCLLGSGSSFSVWRYVACKVALLTLTYCSHCLHHHETQPCSASW